MKRASGIKIGIILGILGLTILGLYGCGDSKANIGNAVKSQSKIRSIDNGVSKLAYPIEQQIEAAFVGKAVSGDNFKLTLKEFKQLGTLEKLDARDGKEFVKIVLNLENSTGTTAIVFPDRQINAYFDSYYTNNLKYEFNGDNIISKDKNEDITLYYEVDKDWKVCEIKTNLKIPNSIGKENLSINLINKRLGVDTINQSNNLIYTETKKGEDSKEIILGETAESIRYRITAEKCEELKNFWKAPESGHKIIGVTLLAESSSNLLLEVDANGNFYDCKVDGKDIDVIKLRKIDREPREFSGILDAGKKLRGMLIFEVPENFKELKIHGGISLYVRVIDEGETIDIMVEGNQVK